MRDAGTQAETERYIRCRNLVWEAAPQPGPRVPGRYCSNRLGVVSATDCPVYQGIECCLFDPRDDDEEPAQRSEDEIDEIRAVLTADYLRWPYWKRVNLLRQPNGRNGYKCNHQQHALDAEAK